MGVTSARQWWSRTFHFALARACIERPLCGGGFGERCKAPPEAKGSLPPASGVLLAHISQRIYINLCCVRRQFALTLIL